MAPQTTLAPYNDSVLTYGAGYAIPLHVTAPFLETQATFGHTALVGTPTGGVVATVGSTELDESFTRSFRDELTGTGSFALSMANDDPDLPGFNDVIRLSIDGYVRFAGLVEAKQVTTYTESEKAGEVTLVTGRGSLALLDSGLVEPASGLDAEPVEVVRSFSWMSLDFDGSSWPDSKRIRRTDVPTARPPHRYSPEWWPDPESWWVWANRPDVSEWEAPGGRCPFRHEFTLASDAVLAFFVAMDNMGTAYFDGAKIADTENDTTSYTIGRRIEFPVTAGDHVFAASILNTGRAGGLNFTIWTVDDEGLLDTMIEHSDSYVQCRGYGPLPGFTAGRALRIAREEAQARGDFTGITDDFDDNVDSSGNAWLTPAEITVEVGRSVLEFGESLTDWLVDLQMAPGAEVVRAWNWGTRGGTPGVTVAATTDPATSEVAGLMHDGRHARVNRLVIRYRQGYTEVSDATSIGTHGQLSAFVDLGDVNTAGTAESIGEMLLDLRKDPSYAHTLTLAPVSATPYATFDNGDYITHPDEDDSTSLSRVRSISVTEDDANAELTYVLELNDIREELEARHDNWLKRKAMGALAGGAKVVSRSGEPLQPAVRISTTNVAEFSYDNTALTASYSPKRPADSSGNLIELYGTLTTAGSTTTTVVVYQDGVAIGTLTFPAGEEVAELNLEAAKCFRNINVFQVRITAAGSGAEGLDVQVRAI